MRLLLGFLVFFVLPIECGLAARPVTWADLKDPAASNFIDPFQALSIPDLRALGTVLRLRNKLGATGFSAEERAGLEAQLADEEAKLAAAGIRTDWLLDQRDEIGKKRAQAAFAGNPALNGKPVTISGYVIPILEPDGQSHWGYLVPDYGMCSHMPAPDPNQMIRYHGASGWAPDEIYQPVVLSGTLTLAVSRQTINLLDGNVEMIAVFDIEDADLQPVRPGGKSLLGRTFRFFHQGQ